MSRRSVLVTGAGGFVGSTLVTSFAELGLDVIAVDRAFDDEADGAASMGRVRRMTGELDAELILHLPPVDLVVHGAWITTDPEYLGITREEYAAENLEPLRRILEWARSREPAALVFLSSSGVFGAGDGDDALTDADTPTSKAPYAEAKREAERLALLFAGEAGGGPETFVVRLGYLFGPDERSRPTRTGRSLVTEWIASAEKGEPLPVRSDDPARDWTYTGDLAPALLRLVDGPSPPRAIHLGSPHRYRDSEVASLIAGRYPRARVTTVPDGATVKAPMAPSEVPALEGFGWTDLPTALQLMVGQGASV
ncbi:MAG: NAD(P)-dependent oxidoreductase [Gemmatimonadetes bacterium]|nr:NAD(P)-dependent oxidoreductase [Gemmatimonadota bacterium]